MLEAVVDFLSSGSTAAWLVAVAICVVAFGAVGVFGHAYRAGREISLWPPKIGQHQGTDKAQPGQSPAITPPVAGPVWQTNSREVDERAHWTTASTLVIGVQYSPKFFKDFFDVIQARSQSSRATLALVLEPDGAATRYLKESATGTAGVAEGVQEIERMTREADGGRGYARVKKHDRVMRYSFIRTEDEIWVKFFTNSAHRAIVPAVKVERDSELYAFFAEDIRQLELASHD